MTSAIDAAFPAAGSAYTATVRTQFATAKTEITALQAAQLGTIRGGTYLVSSTTTDQYTAIQGVLDLAHSTGQETDFRGLDLAFDGDLYFYTQHRGGRFISLNVGSGSYGCALRTTVDNVALRELSYTQPNGRTLTIVSTTGSGGNLLTVVVAEVLADLLFVTGQDVVLWGVTSPSNHNFSSAKNITVTGASTFTVAGTFTNGAGTLASTGGYCRRTRFGNKPGIVLRTGVNVRVEGVEVRGCRGPGINISQMDSYHVTENYVHETGADGCITLSTVLGAGGRYGTYTNNIFEKVGDDALSVVGITTSATENEWLSFVGNKSRNGYDIDYGGGFRVSGGRNIAWIDNSLDHVQAGFIIGVDAGYATTGCENILVKNYNASTAGSVTDTVGALVLKGSATYPSSNVEIDGGTWTNIRYRAVHCAAAAAGDIKNLTIKNVHVNDVGTLNDNGTTGRSDMALDLDYIENLTLSNLIIEETGGAGILGLGTSSGIIRMNDIRLAAINSAGSASNDGITINASADVTIYDIGNVIHTTQVGKGGTYTLSRLIEFVSFTDTRDPRILWSGRQVSLAASGITTAVPFGVAGFNATDRTGVILFTVASAINLAATGDTALVFRGVVGAAQIWSSWVIERVYVSWASGAFNTNCQITVRDAASGGGNLIASTTATGAATEVRFLSTTATIAEIPLDATSTGPKFVRGTDITLFVTVTTANGAALTGNVTIYGRPF